MIRADYSGRTVVITGAAGGIGAGMCRVFAANGAKVAVCDINEEGCKKLADELCAQGYTAKPFVLNVTDRDGMGAVAEIIADEFDGIDVLINNAGVNVGPNDRFPVDKFSPEKWDWISTVDLDGVFNVSRAFIPYLKQKKGGNIVNISSVVGVVPLRNQCAFAAAKAAVVNLTKAMAIELAPDGVRVNCICPGSIMMDGTKALFYGNPEMAEKMMVNIPQHRPGDPEDIAYAALYLADECAGYVTGAINVVDGGWTCGFARDF